VRIVVDLDGTLCEQVDTSGPLGIMSYADAEPIWESIEKLNDLYYLGWHVTIFTARGMNTLDGDVEKIERVLRGLTERWLKNAGVFYDVLKFGKPPADFYVDDRSLRPDEFVSENFEE
jgi:capsule biosynthesis phosphatase